MESMPPTKPAVSPASGESVDAPQLEGKLGTGGLLLTVLAFNAPISVMAGLMPVVIAIGLGPATPFVYLGTMVLMLFFAAGLVALARHMSQLGVFDRYITHAMGRRRDPAPGSRRSRPTSSSPPAPTSSGHRDEHGLDGSVARPRLAVVGMDRPRVGGGVGPELGQRRRLHQGARGAARRRGRPCAGVGLRVFVNGGPQGHGLDLAAGAGNGSWGLALLKNLDSSIFKTVIAPAVVAAGFAVVLFLATKNTTF
jgi:hypothetical protein